MRWIPVAVGLAGALIPVVAQSRVYLSIEQAQREMLPGVVLTPHPIVLTNEQQARMRAASSVSHPFQGNRVWKAPDGSWFVVDEVVGKHEFITYAVALDARGTVLRVEVLEYRESYGHEVAARSWLAQFEGRNQVTPIDLGRDIANIGGATLSCKHLTDGVKRVLVLHTMALRSR
ncbi:FMN-binding protein [Xylophilus sp. GOD-11R]|uniref:FMN-binding protein n=1 Tax=Xylophilus sp. GOD-11R TaxID=3089814 RepID=UPI00298C6426|nr:FMN-binding protein [Xylophilus sp. GOD-11R]WPB54951.1 FMN-binding protein [Xylophilus sp. GOD-11R]